MRFAMKALCLIAVLIAVVALGAYGLTFIKDQSEREILAILAGAAATIFAGWLAWESAIFQAQRADQEKVARAIARKEDAVVAIVQPIHAAAAWLSSLIKETSQPGDRDGKSLRTKRQARQLDQVLDRHLLLALMSELGADDRINLLMIAATMRTAIAMTHMHSAADVVTADELVRIKDILEKLENHLVRFDADLHRVFLRDSGLSPSGAAALPI